MTDLAAAPAQRGETAAWFAFVQIEVPWPLGPTDGRYVLRDDGQVTHVVVLATLGAAQRRRLASRRRARPVDPEPDPTPVATGRATVIMLHPSLADEAAAQRWLAAAGPAELTAALQVINRVLDAHRVIAADPYVPWVGRTALLAARLGFGAGQQVADGRWTQARDVTVEPARGGRRRADGSSGRLAAVLGAKATTLVCEELVLRARRDLDAGRPREAALQLLVALDAAVAELAGLAAGDPDAAGMGTAGSGPAGEQRLGALRARREPVAQAAQRALTANPTAAEQEVVAETVQLLQAALRARSVTR